MATLALTANRPADCGRSLPWLPWTDGTGRRRSGWRDAPVFTPAYIIASWLLFIPAAERINGKWSIDEEAVGHLLYHVPDLSRDFPLALRSLLTAPWLNHDSLQLIYVTALLLIFGLVFEVREGTIRLVLVFFGTTFLSAIAGGLVLDAIYPELWDTRMLEKAWERTWSGGSVGCFGVMGAIAGRTRRPFALVLIFLAWEGFLWWVNLRSYTSVFHITALGAGFVATRFLIPPVRAAEIAAAR